MRPAPTRALAVALALALPLGPPAGAGGGRPDTPPPTQLVRVAPGTVVGDQPPPGWTHIVVKSTPRLAAGDLETLPGVAARTATLFRTVILADIRREAADGGAFAIRRVGIGLCMPDRRGRDVVVTADRIAGLDVPAGALEQAVLSPAEALLGRGRLIAGPPTFAVYRGPATLRVGADHREVDLCYGLLADPRAGSLRVALWAVDPAAPGAAGPDRLRELPRSYLWSCPIDVKASLLFGRVPVSWSFAIEALPGEASRPVPPPLRPLLRAGDPPAGDLRRLEEGLALMLNEPPASSSPPPARGGADGPGPARSGRTSTAGSGPP